jgi:hypothetical protein
MAEIVRDNYEMNAIRPSDINEHLPTLRKYATKCSTIAEMGVRGCVSTWAFIQGLIENKEQKKELMCVDIDDLDLSEIITIAKDAGVNVKFIKDDSAKVDLGKRVDLLFIDTWHVYGHLKRELEFHHSNVDKYIIMHDTTVDAIWGESMRCGSDVRKQAVDSGYSVEEICKGLTPAIDEFLESHYPEWTLLEKFENCNGLTILKRLT